MASTLTHANSVDGTTLFTPVSSAIANIGTSTTLGWTSAFVALMGASGGTDIGGMYDSTAANFYNLMGINSSSYLGVDDSTANLNGTAFWNATSWFYVVVTYPGGASGTQKLTFHWKDLTLAGSWTHQAAASANYVVKGSGSTTNIWCIGTQNGTSSDWNDRAISIGLCAAWGTVALTNAQVEALSPNAAATSKTSDAYNNAAGKPDMLIECTSTGYETDIGNHPSTFSSTANWTLTGANPTGWTFDGVGTATLPPDLIMASPTSQRIR